MCDENKFYLRSLICFNSKEICVFQNSVIALVAFSLKFWFKNLICSLCCLMLAAMCFQVS